MENISKLIGIVEYPSGINRLFSLCLSALYGKEALISDKIQERKELLVTLPSSFFSGYFVKSGFTFPHYN